MEYPYRYMLSVEGADLMPHLECDDHHRIVREIEHLDALGLVQNTVLYDYRTNPTQFSAHLSATPLGQNLYVRCQGFRGAPAEYWNSKTPPKPGDS